ncbi:hypothetical protein [Weissella confusa]|uniref:hypothetical protein n=1 Tax=Weissella confusa TaxID=1583 RepID=UPI00177DFFD5|nr:hypothetical protein [Weissella confusa]MBD5833641.1 hypothetical protein [Weissella confusa]
MNKFDNVDALLKELGISRATAYRRARKYDISLSDLSSGLSDDEIEKLKKPLQNSGKQKGSEDVEKYRIKVSEMSDIIASLKTEISSQKERYDMERKRNDERETVLLDKLGEAQQLVSQSQQLQLMTEKKLVKAEEELASIKMIETETESQTTANEPKMGWLTRLFG